MRYEDYDKQKILYERFIENSNLKDFYKMKQLSDNNYNNSNSKKQKFNAKNLFHSYKYNFPSYEIFKKIKGNNIQDEEFFNDKNDLRNSYTPSEINNYKLDFNNIIFDPEYKNKCLKGNYKWGNMKFNIQKLNMAKRRGVSFEDIKLNKIDKKNNKINTMEINGRMIIGGNNIQNINTENNIISKIEKNNEYNKKKIFDIINKNSDFIKRKYSGKLNVGNLNNYQKNNLNENEII